MNIAPSTQAGIKQAVFAIQYQLGSLDEVIYGLAYTNVRFENGIASYQAEMDVFFADFQRKSSKGMHRDWAWNMMFAASYTYNSFANNGVASFYTNGDARILYDQNVNYYGTGFANAEGTCVPANSNFHYDSALGSFVME
eukprot:gene40085-49572_t